MKKIFNIPLCVIAYFIGIVPIISQPDVIWDRDYGESNTLEELKKVEELPSGGYIACGSSGSNAWLLKVDENGIE